MVDINTRRATIFLLRTRPSESGTLPRLPWLTLVRVVELRTRLRALLASRSRPHLIQNRESNRNCTFLLRRSQPRLPKHRPNRRTPEPPRLLPRSSSYSPLMHKTPWPITHPLRLPSPRNVHRLVVALLHRTRLMSHHPIGLPLHEKWSTPQLLLSQSLVNGNLFHAVIPKSGD